MRGRQKWRSRYIFYVHSHPQYFLFFSETLTVNKISKNVNELTPENKQIEAHDCKSENYS